MVSSLLSNHRAMTTIRRFGTLFIFYTVLKFVAHKVKLSKARGATGPPSVHTTVSLIPRSGV